MTATLCDAESQTEGGPAGERLKDNALLHNAIVRQQRATQRPCRLRLYLSSEWLQA